MSRTALFLAIPLALAVPAPGAAQGFSTAAARPRPWSRVSFFVNTAAGESDGIARPVFTELTTSFTYQLPDSDDAGAEYGVDLRYGSYSGSHRPERVSIYEGFVGARLADGALRLRAGHVWLNDLGALGAVAGGAVEVRQRRLLPDDGRFRAGAFAGFEPNVYETGYVNDVKKFGAYVAYDGARARRHSIGYVMIRQGSMTERAVVTASNFLPLGRRVFMYQAGEFDVQPPAGMARRGLAYFYSNTRVNPGNRVELQSTYSRGRSVDARGLSTDVLNGRPVSQSAIDGLLYESVGGRITVQPVSRVHVYGGYSRDKNNRDADPTGRMLVGGYASNLFGSGIDASASQSRMARTGSTYTSLYASVGRQIGRRVYLSGDYTTSLSVVRFSRSDGIVIETRPETRRLSGSASVIAGKSLSLLATLERTNDDRSHELRMMAGVTYRLR